jgi:hypothetical protein
METNINGNFIKDGPLLQVTDNMAKVSRPLCILLIIFPSFTTRITQHLHECLWDFDVFRFFLSGYKMLLCCLLLNCSPSYDTACLSEKDIASVWPTR